MADVGLPVKAPCRKHGVTDAGYCRWKARLGGISLSDARRQSRAGRRRGRDLGRSRSGERCRSIRRPSRIVIPFDPEVFGTAANNGQMISETGAAVRLESE